MNLKVLRLSLIGVILLGLLFTMSACGKRGDPARPGQAPESEAQILP